MIYLDHAATTALRAEALDAMLPFLGGDSATPAASTPPAAMRRRPSMPPATASPPALNARSSEVLFTSGGTESINSALLGIGYAMRRAGAGNHVVTSAIEHQPASTPPSTSRISASKSRSLGCDLAGRVRVEEFAAALRPDTVVASVMLANNEVGTIQPIAEIAAARPCDSRADRGHRVLLHTDAVQAPGLARTRCQRARRRCTQPLIAQVRRPQGQRRALPAPGDAVSCHCSTAAARRCRSAPVPRTSPASPVPPSRSPSPRTGITERSRRVRALRDQLRDGILERVPDVHLNGCQENCLPNNLNISFAGVESDALVAALDERGIAVSSGSACSNSTWEPSHVLLAMGVPIRRAVGSIRFSLGEDTTARHEALAQDRACALPRSGIELGVVAVGSSKVAMKPPQGSGGGGRTSPQPLSRALGVNVIRA